MKALFKKAFKFTLLLLPIIIVACLAVTLWGLEGFTDEMRAELIAIYGSMVVVVIISTLPNLLTAVICTFFGYVIAVRVGLMRPLKFEKNPLIVTAIWAVIGGVALLGLDMLSTIIITQPESLVVEDATAALLTPLAWVAALLYGGIVEELMLRLFMMSLIALIVWKLFFRKHDRENIPIVVFIVANILAAFLFGVGHLPGLFAAFEGITAGFVIRTILLNMIGGVIFGELYRKYGLQYAIIAHAGFHVVMKSILMIIS